jgi:hypothetical protein
MWTWETLPRTPQLLRSRSVQQAQVQQGCGKSKSLRLRALMETGQSKRNF